MADETASTATSTEQTAEATAAATDATTGTEQTATETNADAGAGTNGDDLGTTALGNDEGSIAAENTADGETNEAADVVPETYELATPEGFEKLDEQAVAAATPVFKKLGLTNEQANELVPVVADYAKRIIAERDQHFLQVIGGQRKSWLEEAKADKEIGGANWDTTLQSAAKALDQLGFPKGSPLRTALDDSGFGNHPEMVRAWARVGKAIGEDPSFVRGDADAAVKPKEAKDVFWPGQSPDKA